MTDKHDRQHDTYDQQPCDGKKHLQDRVGIEDDEDEEGEGGEERRQENDVEEEDFYGFTLLHWRTRNVRRHINKGVAPSEDPQCLLPYQREQRSIGRASMSVGITADASLRRRTCKASLKRRYILKHRFRDGKVSIDWGDIGSDDDGIASTSHSATFHMRNNEGLRLWPR